MFVLAGAVASEQTLPKEPEESPSCYSALLAILFLNPLWLVGYFEACDCLLQVVKQPVGMHNLY